MSIFDYNAKIKNSIDKDTGIVIFEESKRTRKLFGINLYSITVERDTTIEKDEDTKSIGFKK